MSLSRGNAQRLWRQIVFMCSAAKVRNHSPGHLPLGLVEANCGGDSRRRLDKFPPTSTMFYPTIAHRRIDPIDRRYIGIIAALQSDKS